MTRTLNLDWAEFLGLLGQLPHHSRWVAAVRTSNGATDPSTSPADPGRVIEDDSDALAFMASVFGG